MEAYEWQQLFTTAAESAIEKWFKKQDNHGVPITIKAFTVFLKYWLVAKAERESLPSYNRPADISKNWIRHYLDRHPGLPVRYAVHFDSQKTLCSNFLVIMKYFQKLARCIYKHGIKPREIINLDEKDYFIGPPDTLSLGIIRARRKNIRLTITIKRDLITLINAICVDGFVLPVFHIAKEKSHRVN